MSGEHFSDGSDGWSVTTLKAFLEQRIQSLETLHDSDIKRIEDREQRLHERLERIDNSVDLRLRADDYERYHRDLAARVSGMEIRLTAAEGLTRGFETSRARIYAFVGAAVGLVTIIIIVVDHFISK